MATQKFLRLPAVEAMTGYRRSTIYRLAKENKFPAPISLGGRASAWIEAEISAWMEARVAASRNSGGGQKPVRHPKRGGA